MKITKKTSPIWMAILAVFATLALNTAKADIIVQDNFDSYTAGQTAPGWGGLDGASFVSNAQSVSTPNSLAITDPSSAYKSFPSPIALTSNTQYEFSVDFRATNLSASSLFRVLMMNDVPNHFGALGGVFAYNGTIYARSGASLSGDVALGTYSADTWYTLVFSLKPSDGNFDVVFKQGNTVLSSANNVSFDLGSNANLDANPVWNSVFFSNGFSAGTEINYIDNVLVQSLPVPEPSVVALLGAICPLAFLAIRKKFRRVA